MSNETISYIFEDILESIVHIERRFSSIHTPNDFALSSTGIDKLDAIAMRLQVIGEQLKLVDKLSPEFFSNYPDTEWKKIIAMRDIISHHYANINLDIIFDVCTSKIPFLKETVIRIISDLTVI